MRKQTLNRFGLPVRRYATRNGSVLIYGLMMMTALCGIMAMVVDWGHITLTRGELRTAADASARAGAAAVANYGYGYATNQALSAAADNKVDGVPLALQRSDVTFLKWWWRPTGSTQALQQYDACQVDAKLLASRGNAVQLTLAALFGVKQKNLGYKATALVVPAVNMDQDIKATWNPWLAGMPAGTSANVGNPHNNPDYADGTPGHVAAWASPQAASGVPIFSGEHLQFDSISGTARHDPTLAYFEPDGQLSDIGGNISGAEHGMSNLIAPINALIGVFLDDTQPNLSVTPTFSSTDLQNCPTDYSTADARNKTTYSPKLKQVFFIGDGQTDNGTPQSWVVPDGATRLYLCTMDFYEWNNNAGSRTVTLKRPQQVILVK